MPTSAPGVSDIAALAAEAGLRRIHVLAWRDLVDIEAGGSELHADRILRLWAEAGLEVTLRTSYAQGHPERATRSGYRVIRSSGRIGVFPNSVISEMVGRHGRRDGIVEIWNGVPFLTPVWARGPRITWIHHVHRDMWEMVLTPTLARFGRALEHRLAPPFYRSTSIVTLSNSSRDEIVDYLGLPRENISVVHPGIDDFFHPADERAPVPTVVAVGRLMPSKRFDQLIRIASDLKATIPDLQVVIAGEGYERPELEALIAQLDAASWIRLAGRVSDDELRALYRRAWVVASTSLAEGWGMTLTEAAACGTPSVATDIAGHRDAIDPDHSGLLGSDLREVREALAAVLLDPDLRQRLSAGALQHAARLRWSATAYGTFLPLAEDAIARR
ncbi:MAG: glycosyltransferase family 4 protein [Acidobacteria bacterium]|nr:glycosyltransferase family 4 protein [Acidobacteriota bacterium]